MVVKRSPADRRTNGGRREGIDQRTADKPVSKELRENSDRREEEDRRVGMERRATSYFGMMAA